MEFELPDKPSVEVAMNAGHKEKKVGKRRKNKTTKQSTSLPAAHKKSPEPKTWHRAPEEAALVKSEVDTKGDKKRPKTIAEEDREQLSEVEEDYIELSSFQAKREFEIPLNRIDLEAEILLHAETYEPLPTKDRVIDEGFAELNATPSANLREQSETTERVASSWNRSTEVVERPAPDSPEDLTKFTEPETKPQLSPAVSPSAPETFIENRLQTNQEIQNLTTRHSAGGAYDFLPLENLPTREAPVSSPSTKLWNNEVLGKWHNQRQTKKLKIEQNKQTKKLRQLERAQLDRQHEQLSLQGQINEQSWRQNMSHQTSPTEKLQHYTSSRSEQLHREELPEEAKAIVERLNIPPEHRLEHSTWHSIEVDKKTGHAVQAPTINYGEAFRQEQRQELFLEEPSEVSIASGQLAVATATDVNVQSLMQNPTLPDNRSKKSGYNSPLENTIRLTQHVASSSDVWLWLILGLIIIAIIATIH